MRSFSSWQHLWRALAVWIPACLASAAHVDGQHPEAVMALETAASPAPDTALVQVDGVVTTRTLDPSHPGPGARIRYRTSSEPDRWQEAWVDEVVGETMLVWSKNPSEPTTIRRSDLQSLEMRGPGAGRAGGARAGLAFGLGAGLVIGGVIGAQNEPDCRPSEWFCYKGLATAGGALLGSAIGMAVGALIGYAVAPDGWIEVPVAGLEVRTASAGLSVRLPVR